MSKNTYFTAILLAVLFGIFLQNFLEDIILSCIIESFLFLIGTIFVFSQKQVLRLYFLVFFFCLFGIIYSYQSTLLLWKNMKIIERYEDLYLSYTGEVQEVYKRTDFYDEYRVKLQELEGVKIETNIQHLLRVPKNFHLQTGQHISYQGKLYPIEDFDGFSYKKYLLSRGIYFSTSSSKVEVLSQDIHSIRFVFSSFRSKLLATIWGIFPKEEAIFLGWILFGARENIPADLKEDFNNSGLTHFIAVSGFNITLCILFITFLFGFLPSWARIIAVTLSIVIFSVFVGLWAPVVRAAIMGIVWYILLQQGSSAKNMSLLAFTALCMALWSPFSLNYDVSLHLSFLAVIGIIYTQEYFKKCFFWVPSFFAIREAFVLTLSALSFSLPLMIFQFGQVSLLAPFANIAMTWTIPLAMIGGSLTLIWNYISPFLWEFIGFFTWILLHYDIMVVRFFGNIESALWKVDVGNYGMYLQTLYFIILTYILVLQHFRTKKQPF